MAFATIRRRSSLGFLNDVLNYLPVCFAGLLEDSIDTLNPNIA